MTGHDRESQFIGQTPQSETSRWYRYPAKSASRGGKDSHFWHTPTRSRAARVAFSAHTIVSNIDSVGTGTLNSYLITAPVGHILIKDNFEKAVPLLLTSIREGRLPTLETSSAASLRRSRAGQRHDEGDDSRPFPSASGAGVHRRAAMRPASMKGSPSDGGPAIHGAAAAPPRPARDGGGICFRP